MGCPWDENTYGPAPYRVGRWAEEVTADERNVMRHGRRGAECAITAPSRLDPDRVIPRKGAYQPTEAVVEPLLEANRKIRADGKDGGSRPCVPEQSSDAPLRVRRAGGPSDVDDGKEVRPFAGRVGDTQPPRVHVET